MSQLSANFATINLQLDQKRLFSTTPLQLERTKNKQKKTQKQIDVPKTDVRKPEKKQSTKLHKKKRPNTFQK